MPILPYWNRYLFAVALLIYIGTEVYFAAQKPTKDTRTELFRVYVSVAFIILLLT